MVALLLLALLQAPDDLAGFLASLEKERAKGATSEDLLKKVDAWAQGKPADVAVRIGWNRGLLEATIKIDTLFIEGLKKRVGKEIKMGPVAGQLRELKSDRLVLGVSGGQIEVMLSTIPQDVRLGDVKKEGLLPARSPEEALFLFAAAGKTISALATARAVSDAAAKDAALAAFAGKILQDIDRGLAAGPLLKVAQDLSATWAKEEDVLNAAGGALRKCFDGEIAPRLLAEAETLLPTNRPAARRHLDLAALLARDPAILKETRSRKWKYLAAGEWHAVPLDSLPAEDLELDGSKIVLERKDKGGWTDVTLKDLSIAWEEISGLRMKIRPGTTGHVHFILCSEDFETQHSLSLVVKEAWAWYSKRTESSDKGGPTNPTELTKKDQYEFRSEGSGKFWKYFVDTSPVRTFEFEAGPKSIRVMTDVGRAEITSLEVRKK